jgi:hypothetical protein
LHRAHENADENEVAEQSADGSLPASSKRARIFIAENEARAAQEILLL